MHLARTHLKIMIKNIKRLSRLSFKVEYHYIFILSKFIFSNHLSAAR